MIIVAILFSVFLYIQTINIFSSIVNGQQNMGYIILGCLLMGGFTFSILVLLGVKIVP